MNNRSALLGITFLACLSVNTVSAQHNLNGTSSTFVTTAVPFLRISPDARAGAMGDAGIAVTTDPNAQYWNVAKIPFSDKNYGFSATYTPWLKDLVPDIFLAYLAGYAKFGKDNNQAVSASMRYFSLGNINYTDINASPIGTGMPREYSFDGGYSQKLSPNLSVGASLRYIHSAIASGVSAANSDYKPGNAFSADAGIFYTKNIEKVEDHVNTISFGAVASNIGSKISYNSTRKDFIPMNLGVGMAYTYQVDQYNKFTFALDLNKLLVPVLNSANPDTQVSIINGITSSFSTGNQVQEVDASLGIEYWYQSLIAFRAGYFYEDKNNGDRQYITTGLGVKYNIFQINASYIIPEGSGTNRNPLSNTVRFSLVFQFDKIEGAGSSGDDNPTTQP